MEDTISNDDGAPGGPLGVQIDPTTVDARPAVREAVQAAGLRPRDIGRGRMAWSRHENDTTQVTDGTHIADSTHVMVSCNGRLDGDPERAEWTAGRYGDAGGFVEVAGLTLREALEAVELLPKPLRVDGSQAEAVYPSLDEAMSDFA